MKITTTERDIRRFVDSKLIKFLGKNSPDINISLFIIQAIEDKIKELTKESEEESNGNGET